MKALVFPSTYQKLLIECGIEVQFLNHLHMTSILFFVTSSQVLFSGPFIPAVVDSRNKTVMFFKVLSCHPLFPLFINDLNPTFGPIHSCADDTTLHFSHVCRFPIPQEFTEGSYRIHDFESLENFYLWQSRLGSIQFLKSLIPPSIINLTQSSRQLFPLHQ